MNEAKSCSYDRRHRPIQVVSLGAAAMILLGEVKAATSTTDAWDVSQGVNVTFASPTEYGSAVSSIFGDSQVPPDAPWEVGHTIFRDFNTAGYVDVVEWNTTATILLQGYNLTLVDDFQTGNRGISLFRLYGKLTGSDSWQLLDTFTPTTHPYSPYGETFPEDFVEFEHTGSFAPIASRFFRAEFTQYNPDFGVRVVELDAITVPEPSSSVLLASGTLIGVFMRRRTIPRKG